MAPEVAKLIDVKDDTVITRMLTDYASSENSESEGESGGDGVLTRCNKAWRSAPVSLRLKYQTLDLPIQQYRRILCFADCLHFRRVTDKKAQAKHYAKYEYGPDSMDPPSAVDSKGVDLPPLAASSVSPMWRRACTALLDVTPDATPATRLIRVFKIRFLGTRSAVQSRALVVINIRFSRRLEAWSILWNCNGSGTFVTLTLVRVAVLTLCVTAVFAPFYYFNPTWASMGSTTLRHSIRPTLHLNPFSYTPTNSSIAGASTAFAFQRVKLSPHHLR
jgi:hypothetical protein